MEERIQKIMAQAGLGSRRDCEEYIIAGRVRVNGVLAEIGQKADPAFETITLDGRAIKPPQEKIYVALHKPRYVLSTVDAEQGDSRQTVRDLVPISERLYPVGRLDFDSEGLILMTNDGELAQKLTHPSYQHSKEYRVLLARQPDTEQMATWQRGVVLEDGYKTQRAELKIESLAGKGAWIRIVMREGRKRQIREIGSMLGLPVVRIVRIRIGNLNLGDLKPAEWRYLTPVEIKALKEDRPGLGPYPDMTRKSPVKVRARLETKRTGRTLPPSGPAVNSKKHHPAGEADRTQNSNRSPARTGRNTGGPRTGESNNSAAGYKRPQNSLAHRNDVHSRPGEADKSTTHKQPSQRPIRRPVRRSTAGPANTTSGHENLTDRTIHKPASRQTPRQTGLSKENHKPSGGVRKSRPGKP